MNFVLGGFVLLVLITPVWWAMSVAITMSASVLRTMTTVYFQLA